MLLATVNVASLTVPGNLPVLSSDSSYCILQSYLNAHKVQNRKATLLAVPNSLRGTDVVKADKTAAAVHVGQVVADAA